MLLLFTLGLVSWLEAGGVGCTLRRSRGLEMRSWAIADNPVGCSFLFFLPWFVSFPVTGCMDLETGSRIPSRGSKSLCGLETGGVWACAAARHHAAHASHVRQENGGSGFRRG
jgi:hypothetical protein